MTMRKQKRKNLEADGWRVGTTQEFLGLSHEEATLIEVKLALSRALKARRLRRGLSQADLAAQLCSSQSRVAKMEAGDSSVSIDLLVRSLLALGTSPKELAKSIGQAAP
jgi:ribosome-binding protein aMBF1 (putative translation factor)